jgi:hypothetical protein
MRKMRRLTPATARRMSRRQMEALAAWRHWGRSGMG